MISLSWDWQQQLNRLIQRFWKRSLQVSFWSRLKKRRPKIRKFLEQHQVRQILSTKSWLRSHSLMSFPRFNQWNRVIKKLSSRLKMKTFSIKKRVKLTNLFRSLFLCCLKAQWFLPITRLGGVPDKTGTTRLPNKINSNSHQVDAHDMNVNSCAMQLVVVPILDSLQIRRMIKTLSYVSQTLLRLMSYKM